MISLHTDATLRQKPERAEGGCFWCMPSTPGTDWIYMIPLSNCLLWGFVGANLTLTK